MTLILKTFFNRTDKKYRIVLLVTALFVLSVLLVTHTLGIERKLYYIYEWYDCFTHALGGVFIASFVYAFHETRIFLIPLLAVWISSFFWEIFEFYIVSIPFHLSDSLNDVFFASIGGVLFIIAAEYYRKNN